MEKAVRPTVSVIIPNYNHEAYLELRIESVLAQSVQDFEIILLDDHSSDSSRNIIARYKAHPKVSHVVINERNSGSTFHQWQIGLQLAKGAYCWIAESDDFAEPEFIERLLPSLEGGAGLAFCNSRIVNAEGELVSQGLDGASWLSPGIDRADFAGNYTKRGIDEVRQHLLYSNTMYNASAILVRTDILRSVLDGLSSYRLYGDWLAWIRCCLQCDTIAYDATPLNSFRTHSGNVRSDMSRRYELQLRESIAMREAVAGMLRSSGVNYGDLNAINRREARKARLQLLREAAHNVSGRFALRLVRTQAPADLRNPAVWKSIVGSALRSFGKQRRG